MQPNLPNAVVARYRSAVMLLVATIVVLAVGYHREHERAERGERYFRALNKTRSDLEIADLERAALKREKAHLEEQVACWYWIWELQQPCFGSDQSAFAQFAMDSYAPSKAESLRGDAMKRMFDNFKYWEANPHDHRDRRYLPAGIALLNADTHASFVAEPISRAK